MTQYTMMERKNNMMQLPSMCDVCSCPFDDINKCVCDISPATGQVRAFLCQHCKASADMIAQDKTLLKSVANTVSKG